VDQLWQRAIKSGRPVIVDGSSVTEIDSTGLALMSRFHRHMFLHKRRVAYAKASAILRSAKSLLGLDALFPFYERLADAVDALGQGGDASQWRGEVDIDTRRASTVEDAWKQIESTCNIIANSPGCELSVDLHDVHFMDSTGAGMLIRATRHCTRLGIPCRFMRPSNVVRRAMQAMSLGHLIEGDQPLAPATRLLQAA
jgi:anti-anti-sigma factor